MANERKKKIIILFWTTIFFIVVIFFIFIYANLKNKYTRPLINFAPQDTSFYFELDLSAENFKHSLATSAEMMPLLKKFIIDNQFPDSLWSFRDNIERVALITIPLNHRTEKIWLIKTTGKALELEIGIAGDYFFSILDKDTAVISLSRDAINKIKYLPPSERINAINNYNFYGDHFPIFGFARSAFLKDWLANNIREFQYWEKFFRLNADSNILWSADAQDENIAVKLFIPASFSYALPNVSSDDWARMDGVDNAIVINNFYMKQIINILQSNLPQTGENNWDYFERYMRDKYKIQLNDLYTFFEQQSILVIQPNIDFYEWDGAIRAGNFNFVLIFKKNNQVDETVFINALETFMQNYLAFKYPATKIIILPDKTSGLELVADAEGFVFKEVLGHSNIKSIKKNDFEFDYLDAEEEIFFSNNIGLLNRIANDYNNGNNSQNKNADFLIDLKALGIDWLKPFGFAFLNSSFNDKGILIQGSIKLEP